MTVSELRIALHQMKENDTVLVYWYSMSWDPEIIEWCPVLWELKDTKFTPFAKNINALAINTHLSYEQLHWE